METNASSIAVIVLAFDRLGEVGSSGRLAQFKLVFRANGTREYLDRAGAREFEPAELPDFAREVLKTALLARRERAQGKLRTLAPATPRGSGGRRSDRTLARLAALRAEVALYSAALSDLEGKAQ